MCIKLQIIGMSCIEDMKGLSLKLMAKMTMSVLRKMAFMTQVNVKFFASLAARLNISI